MFKLILSSLILISTSVLAQDSVMIRDFGGGLNTVSSDFDIQSKYARMVHNFDLGRNVGALTRRLGYDSVSSVGTKFDSIMYPRGVYLPDGQQLLLYVGDTAGGQYGGVFSTAYNSANVGSYIQVAQYWGMKYPTSYAMQNGIVFMANGQNRMIGWDILGGKFTTPSYHMIGGNPLTFDRASRPIPPYAPGEIEVYPIKDTAGSGLLYGEYMWTIILKDSTSDTSISQTNGRKLSSYVTTRMTIDSARALISGIYNYFVSDSLIDTCRVRYVKLYRTKANPGPLTKFTTFYATTDSVKFPGGTATIIDNKADASLSTTDTFVVTDREPCERGYGVKPGQPQIKMTAIITDSLTGLARGTRGLGILKWAWACTYVDTSYDAESDTGRRVELDSVNLTILTGGDSTGAKRVELYLPKPKSTYQNMGINVYRAPIFSLIDSTAYWFVDQSNPYQPIVEKKWRKFINKDTSIAGPFRMVGSAKVADSVFVDTFGMEKWSAGQILRQNRPPDGIKNLVSYDGRIFGSAGSRLYLSNLDSGSFAQMRFINLNQDDGDEITAIFPTRRAIRVLKGGSSYNVYQDDGGQWARTEVSSGIGCIAPQSVAHSAAGWYYLSSKGVILENDGPYIERTQATQLISAPLKNFDSLTMAAKRLAVGICADNKYMLCIGDTTYVWDERAQAWGTWSLKFNGATLYGVDANINFVRPDTLYFVQPNSRTLYRYGSSKYDNGTNFNMEWRSAPLMLDNRNKVVNALGVWHKSVDTSDILDFRILNESSTQVAAFADTNLTARYVRLSMPQNLGLGFQIRLLNTEFVVGSGLTRTVIDGIDLYYKDNGKVGE